MSKLIAVLVAVAVVSAACSRRPDAPGYLKDSGYIFGTYYNFVYQSDTDYNDEIINLLGEYDSSLSLYNDSSILSRINRNEDVSADSFFVHVFQQARHFYELSEGRFDITVAPLCRLWKFGKEHSDTISLAEYQQILSKVDSVREFVGMSKVQMVDNKIVKADNRIKLDACAIAEGYGIDVAASVLERHGISNYMIELGGELHVKGQSPSGRGWRIGINKPVDGSTAYGADNQCIVEMRDGALSTSGDYRQYYFTADGRRLSHEINPLTGQPIDNLTRSVTVFGPNTLTTDALSTTLMIYPHDEALALAKTLDGIEAYIIYEDSLGVQHEAMTDGFREMIVR
ncbi:MAG: FAD:protein FMN transferase [Bacteroidales bacterium]|nr:FAD:protein FMN transferase [Bacteroidales bacterium]